MPSSTIKPIADVSVTGWGINGGLSTVWQTLTDGSDSTYISYGGGNGIATCKLLALPANAGTITAVTITLRCSLSSNKNTPQIRAWVENSAGNAQLTATGSFQPTASALTTIPIAVTVNDGNPAHWQNATIQIESDGITAESVAEANVSVTYNSGQQVSPVAAMLLGNWS